MMAKFKGVEIDQFKKRLIDACALRALFADKYDRAFIQMKTRENIDYWDGVCGGVNWGLNTIGDAPTVDAVEVPPIKIGDTAYFIIHGKIYKAEVYFIRWEHHRKYGIHSEISANVGQYSSVGASFNDFGKTVFLTEEEAEAALAKMDGDGNG